jgi:hypothetical protein
MRESSARPQGERPARASNARPTTATAHTCVQRKADHSERPTTANGRPDVDPPGGRARAAAAGPGQAIVRAMTAFWAWSRFSAWS